MTVAASIASHPAYATTENGIETAVRKKTTLSQKLVEKVTLTGVLRHLAALQQIADDNDGRRLAGTPGFNATARYVHDKLAAAGLDVAYQEFPFWFSEELAPPTLEVISPQPAPLERDDIMSMQYAGSGNVSGTVQAVDVTIPPSPMPASTSGCTPEDFSGFVPGNVALVQRGSCGFENKVQNAQAAGAAAVIVFNEGQPGRTAAFFGTLKTPSTIPVVNTSYEVGVLLTRAGTTANVTTSTIVDERVTMNVIAETRSGDPSTVVMAGAHMDSVQYGAGINDNGSGVAALLETAVQAADESVTNKLRFAFWTAEEYIMVGSGHYTALLSEAERARIALYLNFDMLASPNFVRFVLDGDGSATDGANAGPAGSSVVESVFTEYFAEAGLPTAESVLDGGSDYQPFIGVDIPVGGLLTGSATVKTSQQAAVFGGTAGRPFDSCYHSGCDTIDNVSTRALRENSDALAFAVGRFAVDASDVVELASAPALFAGDD
jgi:aminopeptidase Y